MTYDCQFDKEDTQNFREKIKKKEEQLLRKRENW